MLIVSEFIDERMLGGKYTEGGPEERVGSSGKDFQLLIGVDDVEGRIRSL